MHSLVPTSLLLLSSSYLPLLSAEDDNSEEMPLIVPFNEDFAPRIFENEIKQHVLIFGRESDKDLAGILKDMEPAAENFKGEFLFVWVDADAEQEYGLILDSFEVDRKKLPLAKMVQITPGDVENDKPDILTRFDPADDKLDSDSMIKFVEAVKAGEIKGKPVKSHDEDDEIPHDEL